MIRIALVSLVLAAAPGAATPEPESARAFLLRVYEPYTREFDESIYKNLPGYLTPELHALLLKSSEGADARGEVPPLNGDLIVDAQEWMLKGLEVQVREGGQGRAVGTVRFSNLGRVRTIAVDLVKVDGRWRIADLHYDEGRSLTGFLKEAVKEEAAWMNAQLAPLVGKPRPRQLPSSWAQPEPRLAAPGPVGSPPWQVETRARGRQVAILLEQLAVPGDSSAPPVVIDIAWVNVPAGQFLSLNCLMEGAAVGEVFGIVPAAPGVSGAERTATRSWRIDRSNGKLRDQGSTPVTCRTSPQ